MWTDRDPTSSTSSACSTASHGVVVEAAYHEEVKRPRFESPGPSSCLSLPSALLESHVVVGVVTLPDHPHTPFRAVFGLEPDPIAVLLGRRADDPAVRRRERDFILV